MNISCLCSPRMRRCSARHPFLVYACPHDILPLCVFVVTSEIMTMISASAIRLDAANHMDERHFTLLPRSSRTITRTNTVARFRLGTSLLAQTPL